jgi:hypothetical protein
LTPSIPGQFPRSIEEGFQKQKIGLVQRLTPAWRARRLCPFIRPRRLSDEEAGMRTEKRSVSALRALRTAVVPALVVLLAVPAGTLVVNAATLLASPSASTASAEEPIIVAAAGDVACAPGDSTSSTTCRQMDTADVVVGMNPAAVLALGDLQYDRGTAAEFAGGYDPSWGRFKSITHPVPGNHEYDTSGASGYYNYFGSAAGDPAKGYYSWDIGAWHMIALNSECGAVGGCNEGSAQERWLRADLAANAGRCTLAYWHHPLFASGRSTSSVAPFWDALHEAGADLVLSGHSHNYEHFAPQSSSGDADPTGLREFVVGTGGVYFHTHGSLQPNTVARQDHTFGVLKLSLYGARYEWEFVPVAGSTWTDSGSANCHNSSAPPPVAPTAPSGLAVTGTTASQVSLAWSASSPAGGPAVAGYRVYRNGSSTPLNGSPVTSTSYTDTTVAAGTAYSYAVTAVNTAGTESPRSAAVQVTTPGGTGEPPPGGNVLDVPVRASADDAEERTASGAVTLGSGDLNLGQDGDRAQTVGMRFTGVGVPAGATVTRAWVQFQVDEASTAATNLTIAGEAVNSSAAFTTATANVSSRARTAATVGWTPPAWPTAGARGADQRTPDLFPVLQEIISRPGWASGGALSLLVSGTGERTAESVDGGAARAPVLHVEYSTGTTGPVNAAPVVSAGSDASVTRPAAVSLAGSVTDDGLPAPPGVVSATWSETSGPGTVSFADPAAASTTATFSSAGTYVLRLTADDGALQAFDEVTVTVSDATPANTAPVVSAGSDTAVTRPAAVSLAGSVTDDGLPAPPGAVSALWSETSGPGTVSFADPAAAATTATFSSAGTYVLRLTADDGALQAFDEVTVTVSDGGSTPVATILEVPVRTSADDAEERTSSGAMSLGSGDMNLGQDGTNAQTVALRFTGVTLPPGATITAAWVQFQVDEASSGAASLTVAGQAADNAAAFTTTARNVSTRPRTTAGVPWTPLAWPTVAERSTAQRTPDLAAVIQEIVGRPGWASGNALALLVTGTGERTAESVDGGASRAPVLHIEYTT